VYNLNKIKEYFMKNIVFIIAMLVSMDVTANSAVHNLIAVKSNPETSRVEVLNNCSAFVLKEHDKDDIAYIVTAAHCLNDAASDYHLLHNFSGTLAGQHSYNTNTGIAPATFLKSGKLNDLAWRPAKFAQLNKTNYFYPANDMVAIGDHVTVVSINNCFDCIYEGYKVSFEYSLARLKGQLNCNNLAQIHGTSGSPVLNTKGEVIGVLTSQDDISNNNVGFDTIVNDGINSKKLEKSPLYGIVPGRFNVENRLYNSTDSSFFSGFISEGGIEWVTHSDKEGNLIDFVNF
jgi:hypothetical protein